MIRFLKHYFIHEDERGSIKGIVNFGKWEELNIIESQANVTRGNHYHEKTEELFVIIDGKIRISLQKIENEKLVGDKEVYEVKQGDIFIIKPNVNHIFEILEYSKWINALSIKTDEKKPDIKRT